jgi:hypothetical protein
MDESDPAASLGALPAERFLGEDRDRYQPGSAVRGSGQQGEPTRTDECTLRYVITGLSGLHWRISVRSSSMRGKRNRMKKTTVRLRLGRRVPPISSSQPLSAGQSS